MAIQTSQITLDGLKYNLDDRDRVAAQLVNENANTLTGINTFSHAGTSTAAGHIVKSNNTRIGTKGYFQASYSLASTNGDSVTYGSNDCLVEVGTLDVENYSPGAAPTLILIEKVVVNVTTASGATHVGNIFMSDTSGTATNTGLTNGTEVVGAGVTYVQPQLATVGTEADLDLNSTGHTIVGPNVTAAIARKHVYLCTHTGISHDATAGRGTISIEYSII